MTEGPKGFQVVKAISVNEALVEKSTSLFVCSRDFETATTQTGGAIRRGQARQVEPRFR